MARIIAQVARGGRHTPENRRNSAVEQGENAVLEVQVSEVFNASYQWYENAAPISGATGSQYRLDTSETGSQT